MYIRITRRLQFIKITSTSLFIILFVSISDSWSFYDLYLYHICSLFRPTDFWNKIQNFCIILAPYIFTAEMFVTHLFLPLSSLFLSLGKGHKLCLTHVGMICFINTMLIQQYRHSFVTSPLFQHLFIGRSFQPPDWWPHGQFNDYRLLLLSKILFSRNNESGDQSRLKMFYARLRVRFKVNFYSVDEWLEQSMFSFVHFITTVK